MRTLTSWGKIFSHCKPNWNLSKATKKRVRSWKKNCRRQHLVCRCYQSKLRTCQVRMQRWCRTWRTWSTEPDQPAPNQLRNYAKKPLKPLKGQKAQPRIILQGNPVFSCKTWKTKTKQNLKNTRSSCKQNKMRASRWAEGKSSSSNGFPRWNSPIWKWTQKKKRRKNAKSSTNQRLHTSITTKRCR